MSIRIGSHTVAGSTAVDGALSAVSTRPVQNKVVTEALQGISSKVPADATPQNLLVTAATMGDAIASVEARQLYATAQQGSFATKAALLAAEAYYTAAGVQTAPTKNDVAYVLADETHGGKAAKYTVAEASPLAWGFVITFSDTTFTQAQMDAINSGITGADVALIGTAVQSSQKGAANGVAPLDANAKVPASNLPAMDYAPSSHLTDSAAHAALLAAKQDTIADLPSIRVNQTGVTTLTATDTEVTLADNSVNAHTPAASCAYTLPEVTDATKTHRVTLYVKHTATTILASFKDSGGTAITPIGGAYTPAANEVVKYECTWVDALSQWTVEVVSQQYGAITQKGGLLYGRTQFGTTSSNAWIAITGTGGIEGGYCSKALGTSSIALGNNVNASSHTSYVFGHRNSVVYGSSAILVVGLGNTIGNGQALENAIVAGKYFSFKDAALIIGNGTSDNAKYNSFEVSKEGAIRQGITAIPSATSACTITEGVSSHAPSSASTYTLPEMRVITVASVDYIYSATDSGTGYYAWKSGTNKKYTASLTPAVGDYCYTNTALTQGRAAITGNVQTVTHEAVLYADLSTTASLAFQDADGNPVAIKSSTTPAVGEKWTFTARWLFGTWHIFGEKIA